VEAAKPKDAMLKSTATAGKNCDFKQDLYLVKRELAHLHEVARPAQSIDPIQRSRSLTLSLTPSHCLASAGASFFSLMTGHFLASSAFSSLKFP